MSRAGDLSRSLVYGPVPSRRLGRSLGVDLVPFKTCTYDCVYCQLGATTHKTVRRQTWVDAEDVIDQVRRRLGPDPDVIALAGSGEPALSADLGEVVRRLKAITDVPVAVITNGSLLGLPDVRRDLAQADIVLPSLDAADEMLFRRINRPHPSLTLDEVLEGMAAFRGVFSGQIWLEIMLLDGMTGTAAEAERLAALAALFGADRIQLNTVARPPAQATARPVPPELLATFAAAFSPRAEVIASAPARDVERPASDADVLALVARRPCTSSDVAAGLGIHQNAAIKTLSALVERGEVRRHDHDGVCFFTAAPPSDQEEP